MTQAGFGAAGRPKACVPEGTEPRVHARPRERITVGRDAEFLCVFAHPENCVRQVFAGMAPAAHAVLKHEGVHAFRRKSLRVREAFMDGPNVGKAAARIHDDKRRPLLAREEKKPRVAPSERVPDAIPGTATS